jgi:uncharacterized protein
MAEKSKRVRSDKRVIEVRANLVGVPGVWRLLAVSADSLLPEFYRALQGAFGWTDFIMDGRLDLDGAAYEGGKGSRTALRRILDARFRGVVTLADDMPHVLQIEVTHSYEVATRRHYPKVLDGDGAIDACDNFHAERATWDAQDMVHAEVIHAPVLERKLLTLLRQCNPNTLPSKSVEALHGFLSCIISGPLLMPAQWLGVILGDPKVFVNDPQELERGINLVMTFYNKVADEIVAGSLPRAYFGQDWALGYLLGVVINDDEWKRALQDVRLQSAFTPIAEVPNGEPFDRDVIAASVFAIQTWWRDYPRLSAQPHMTVRRTEPKISVNDPCPCGSGKKYKRCCSPLRAL